MGTALDDPEQILLPKRDEQEVRTLEEEDKRKILDRTINDIGIAGGAIATWLATPTLRRPLRMGLSFGVSLVSGCWIATKCEESHIDRILSMKGSREHRELANILVNKSHNPLIHGYLSKHFFPEEVYVDSSVDRPLHFWRYKNSFVDPLAHFQNMSNGEETDSKENNIKKTTMVPKQVNVSAESAEDVPQLETPKALSRREKRREKQSHSRHRWHCDNKETDI